MYQNKEIRIGFETVNAAFQSQFTATEIAGILRDLAELFAKEKAFDGMSLLDCNGNRIGSVQIREGEDQGKEKASEAQDRTV